MNQIIQSPVSIEALDLDCATYDRFIDATNHIERTSESTPSPSPHPITTTDMFCSPKIAQFRSECNLKDRLKNIQPFDSISHNINENQPNSLSKVLSEQPFDTIDRTITPARRYSSSDIDQQSVDLFDMQQRQLIEQQKKRRIYNFNHTLFSNIYKRTHRLSSTDSHIFANSLQNRERNTRGRNQNVQRESDITDEHTTSDRVYSRALEKNTLNFGQQPQYRTTLSVPDGGRPRQISGSGGDSASSRQRISSDSQVENGQQQKMTKLNVESNTRPKRVSFLSSRRRASYYPGDTSNISSDEQKKKRDVIWPLKRSYSFDTPFHRETIEALNKGTFSNFNRKQKKI
jgi:hypothetical protein